MRHQYQGKNRKLRAKNSPDEEHIGFQVAFIRSNHVRCDDSDDRVPQPVGRSGQGNTTGTDRKRENLADEHPSTWSPSGGKEEDEEGDKRNLGVYCWDVVRNGRLTVSEKVRLVEPDRNTDDADDKLTDEHAKGAPDLYCKRTSVGWARKRGKELTRRGRRPTFSIVQKEMGVDKTFTRVKIKEMMKGLPMAPVDCRKGVLKKERQTGQ